MEEENVGITEKKCTRCNKVLQIDEFKIYKRSKDGYSNWCNTCRREYAKEYYKKNRDTVLLRHKEYYEDHKEDISSKSKEYYEKNKEAISARNKQYYENNKDTVLAKNQEYYERIKDDISYKTKKKECDKIRYQKNYPNHKKEIQEKQRQYYYENREKRIEYQKEYYKRNKNKIIAYTYEWQKIHPEIQKLKKERRKIREECNSYDQDQWYECISFFDNKCAYSGEDCLPYTVDHVSDSITIDHIVPLSQGGLNVIWNIVPAKFKYNSSKGNKNLEDWYSQQEFCSEDRLNKIYQWVEYAYNKYGMESLNI